MKSLSHIRYFSEKIGPRGSGTANEKRAQDYCRKVLSKLGYAPREEIFLSTASAYRPFILTSAMMLFSFFLFYQTAFRKTALLLAALATASAFLELLFLPNPIRWILPKKQSRNVFAVAPAARSPKQKILLIAHLDSHRTPLIWRTPGTFKIYRFLSTLGMLAFGGLNLAMLANLFVGDKIVSGISATCVFFIGIVLLMTLQAELTPYTNGANDNASGVGVTLALAEKFKNEPLANSEIWFIFTGCEEVGAHGSFDFVKNHKEPGDAKFIVIDNIGGRDTAPRFYESETMLRKLRYPNDMIALAQSVADDHPQLAAKPYAQKGAYTDGTPFLLAGIAGIAIVGHRDDGWIPDWHSKSDTFDRIDSDALKRAQGFVEKLIERMDKMA